MNTGQRLNPSPTTAASRFMYHHNKFLGGRLVEPDTCRWRVVTAYTAKQCCRPVAERIGKWGLCRVHAVELELTMKAARKEAR